MSYALYVLTSKWISAKKCTEYPGYIPQNSKFNKPKGASVDSSIQLGREKKATTGVGRERSSWMGKVTRWGRGEYDYVLGREKMD